MGETTIEWTRSLAGRKGMTWNPVVGCEYASEGCLNCYAARESAGRLRNLPAYLGLSVKLPGHPARFTGEFRPLPDRLDDPVRWKAPRLVFVNSMSDLFHPDVLKAVHEPTGAPYLAEVLATMVATPRHIYQVLTKRPGVMARVLASPLFRTEVNAALLRRGVPVMKGGFESPWPEHMWFGASIELDKYAFRAGQLRSALAAIRFLSLEPLLGPLPSLDLTGIHWVIVGGESGPGARPMHPQWAEDLRDRCVAAGVPFFFKQWGEWTPYAPLDDRGVFDFSNGHTMANDGTLYEPGALDYPDGPRRGEAIRADHSRASLTSMYRLGKKRAGRELDERTWDQMPGDVSPAPAVAALLEKTSGRPVSVTITREDP